MAVNYKNSAGTDLDSLFYTDSSNGGAIGFLTSGGVDLGNKYTNKSTLGYNVGYKNSAGTDLGYLRGNLIKPSASVTLNKISGNFGTNYDYCEVGEQTWNCSHRWLTNASSWNISSNGGPISTISVTLQAILRETTRAAINFANNTLTIPPHLRGSMYTCANHYGGCNFYSDSHYSLIVARNTWTDWQTLSNSSLSGNFAMQGRAPWSNGFCIRIKAVLSNAAGSITIYSNEIAIS
jgi:hypothetical protein